MPLKARNQIDEDDPRVSTIGHSAPPWLISYADLMTELVCFFVILYALSAALNKDVQAGKKQLEEIMEEEEIAGDIELSREGLRVSMSEEGQMAFFLSGRAEMTPRMIELLGKIAPVIRKLADKFDIIVEGHTDNFPIHTRQYSSNWELSTARATSVVRFLIQEEGFPPPKMAAIGYGEHRPAGPHPNAAGRSRASDRSESGESRHDLNGEWVAGGNGAPPPTSP